MDLTNDMQTGFVYVTNGRRKIDSSRCASLNFTSLVSIQQLWSVLNQQTALKQCLVETLPNYAHVNLHADVDVRGKDVLEWWTDEYGKMAATTFVSTIRARANLSNNFDFNVYVSSKKDMINSSVHLQTNIAVPHQYLAAIINETTNNLIHQTGKDWTKVIRNPIDCSTSLRMNYCPKPDDDSVYSVQYVINQDGDLNLEEYKRVKADRIEEWKAVSILPFPPRIEVEEFDYHEGYTTVCFEHQLYGDDITLCVVVNEPDAVDGIWQSVKLKKEIPFENATSSNTAQQVMDLQRYWYYFQNAETMLSVTYNGPSHKFPTIFGKQSLNLMIMAIREWPLNAIRTTARLKSSNVLNMDKVCKTYGEALDVFDLSQTGHDIYYRDDDDDDKTGQVQINFESSMPARITHDLI